MTVGNSILIGAFIAFSSAWPGAAGANPPPARAGVHAERDTELVGLDHRTHERRHLGSRHTFRQLLHCRARLADPDLAEGQRELVDQRPCMPRELHDRAVEAETGLLTATARTSRGVGQLRPHEVTPAGGNPHRQVGVRDEKAHGGQGARAGSRPKEPANPKIPRTRSPTAARPLLRVRNCASP